MLKFTLNLIASTVMSKKMLKYFVKTSNSRVEREKTQLTWLIPTCKKVNRIHVLKSKKSKPVTK